MYNLDPFNMIKTRLEWIHIVSVPYILKRSLDKVTDCIVIKNIFSPLTRRKSTVVRKTSGKFSRFVAEFLSKKYTRISMPTASPRDAIASISAGRTNQHQLNALQRAR